MKIPVVPSSSNPSKSASVIVIVAGVVALLYPSGAFVSVKLYVPVSKPYRHNLPFASTARVCVAPVSVLFAK